MSRKTTGTPGSSRRRVAVGTALLSLTALIGSQMSAGAAEADATITSFAVYDGTEAGGAAVGPVKGGNTVLVVKGTNLNEIEKVFFGTAEADDLLLEDNTLLYVTPPAGTAAGDVVVYFTEDGESRTAAALKQDYEYTNGPLPTAVAVTDKDLTITGTQLLGSTAVLVGDVLVKIDQKNNKPTDTTVKVKAPKVKSGLLDVSVISPNGIGTVYGAYGAVPVISKITNPAVTDAKKAAVKAASAATGTVSTGTSATGTVGTYTSATGTVVLITGSGFSGLKKVSFGKAVASAVVVNDTTMRVRIPAKAEADAFDGKSVNVAKVLVTVENKFGTSKPAKFEYHRAPKVTAASDVVGAAAAATNTVTLTGDGLQGAKVTFGTKAGKVTASDNGSITVTAPKLPAGEVDLKVTTPAGFHIPTKYTYATTDTLTTWPAS